MKIVKRYGYMGSALITHILITGIINIFFTPTTHASNEHELRMKMRESIVFIGSEENQLVVANQKYNEFFSSLRELMTSKEDSNKHGLFQIKYESSEHAVYMPDIHGIATLLNQRGIPCTKEELPWPDMEKVHPEIMTAIRKYYVLPKCGCAIPLEKLRPLFELLLKAKTESVSVIACFPDAALPPFAFNFTTERKQLKITLLDPISTGRELWVYSGSKAIGSSCLQRIFILQVLEAFHADTEYRAAADWECINFYHLGVPVSIHPIFACAHIYRWIQCISKHSIEKLFKFRKVRKLKDYSCFYALDEHKSEAFEESSHFKQHKITCCHIPITTSYKKISTEDTFRFYSFQEDSQIKLGSNIKLAEHLITKTHPVAATCMESQEVSRLFCKHEKWPQITLTAFNAHKVDAAFNLCTSIPGLWCFDTDKEFLVNLAPMRLTMEMIFQLIAPVTSL